MTTFRTQAEADDKLTEVMGQVKRGVYVNATRTTVEQYLTGTWLPAARATVKPSTKRQNGSPPVNSGRTSA
jgi:hypothetical protein